MKLKGASWDSFFLVVVKLITTLISILLTKILSVKLSLLDYGTYSQANVVIIIGTSILMLGLSDALNFFYNKKDNNDDISKKIKIINTIFMLEIVFGLVFVIIIALSRNLIANYFSNYLIKGVLLIASIKPMLDNLIYMYQVLYVSTGQAKVIAFRNLIVSILKLLIIILIVEFINDITIIFIGLVLLDIIQLLFFHFLFVKKHFNINPIKSSKQFIKPILKYSIPMGIYAIVSMLTREIDKLVIGRVASTEVFAIYANCSKILPFDIIAVSFATVLIPHIMESISSNDNERAANLFKNYIKIGYYSVWILGVSVLLTSEQAITFLYSTEYLPGKTIFILYIVDSLVRFASLHLIITSSGNSKKLMGYSIIALIVNTVLNIVLYYFMGIIGPAVATVISAVLYTILVLRTSIKILNVSWKQVFDFKKILLFILILIISSIPIIMLNKYLAKIELHYFINMLICIGLFVSFNFIVNFKEIKKSIKILNNI